MFEGSFTEVWALVKEQNNKTTNLILFCKYLRQKFDKWNKCHW